MPDLLRIIAYWWKKILLMALAAVVVTTLLLLLQPKLYLSIATALPANSATLDKGRIFNPNVEQLYPALGSADELEKFLGIADLGSLYYELVIEHKLAIVYKLDEADAADKLRTRITVTRSKWNDLKVKAWDEDPQLAAHLANDFLAKAEAVNQKLQQQNDQIILERLQQDLVNQEKALQNLYAGSDSSPQIDKLKRKGIEQQLAQLQQLVHEYTISIQTPLPLLLIAEKASPSLKPDKPRMAQTLAFVLFAALAFGLLAVVFIESRKKNAGTIL